MAQKFTLGDFIHSDEANRRKINNTPGVDEGKLGNDASAENVLDGAVYLFKKCIQPIKEAFPNLAISSGFRCKTLNSIVGGVSKSNHLYGEAADIYDPTGEFSTKEIFEWILMYIPKFYQVIWEFPERGFSETKSNGEHRVNSWVHIAYVKDNHKKTISLASERQSFHKKYKEEWTYRKGKYTHDLKSYQFIVSEYQPTPSGELIFLENLD
jgi:hypothetical protein